MTDFTKFNFTASPTGGVYMLAPYPRIVCSVTAPPATDDYELARLFAAAPKLARELANLVREIENIHGGSQDIEGAIARANEALAELGPTEVSL